MNKKCDRHASNPVVGVVNIFDCYRVEHIQINVAAAAVSFRFFESTHGNVLHYK